MKSSNQFTDEFEYIPEDEQIVVKEAMIQVEKSVLEEKFPGMVDLMESLIEANKEAGIGVKRDNYIIMNTAVNVAGSRTFENTSLNVMNQGLGAMGYSNIMVTLN